MDNKTPIKIINHERFWVKTWFICIALLFFTPLGIFLLFKYRSDITKLKKIILSILFGIYWTVIVFSPKAANNQQLTDKNVDKKASISQSSQEVKKVDTPDKTAQPSEQKQETKKQPKPEPKVSFETFVGWYKQNRNLIMRKCNSQYEVQTLICYQEVYKEALQPELFTKENEDDRSNLMANIALIAARQSADISMAKQIYEKWSVK